MLMSIKKLSFKLPENPFGDDAEKLQQLSTELKSISRKAGINNNKFKAAFNDVYLSVKSGDDLASIIKSKTHVRAVAIALNYSFSEQIEVNRRLLDKIQTTVSRPSSLVAESFFSYFLKHFNQIKDMDFVSKWILKAKQDRKLVQPFDELILSSSGPKWFADKASSEQIDFDQLLEHMRLDRYVSGEFMMKAKQFYYLEQLKTIPLNQPHFILSEIQRQSVYESSYDEDSLLGHVILRTLIERAPHSGISDSWLNVIMSIAGDPRIPTHHPKYRKWWSHVPKGAINKVRGWLSKLDLRLFLEALEAYSTSSGKDELKRMYPSRKRFLEGLHDAGVVTHTRLYLSNGAARYVKNNYKLEHLPKYSHVDGDKSIIYVQLGDHHLIEGSHSCFLWVYRSLSDSALVFDYDKDSVSYASLTSELNAKMEKEGKAAVANIQHNPKNYIWQRNAIKSLKSMNVPIKMKHVLTETDYNIFVREFGVDV